MAAYTALQNLLNVTNGLSGSNFQQMASNAQNLMNDIEQIPVSFSSVSGSQQLQIQSSSGSAITLGDIINPACKQVTICLLRLCQIVPPSRPSLSAMVLVVRVAFASIWLCLAIAFCHLFACRVNINNPTESYSFSESVNVNDLHDTNWFTLNMDGDVFDSYTVPNGMTVNSTEQGGCTSSDDQVMSATATGEAIQQYGMVDPSNLSNSDFIAIVNAPSFLAPAPQPNT